jgi:hypothetical protein
LQFFAGFPQFTIFLGYLCGLIVFFRMLRSWRDNGATGLRQQTSFLGFAAVTVILASAMAMIQLAPTMEFLPHSTRGNGVSWSFAKQFAMPVRQLAGLVHPEAFGTNIQEMAAVGFSYMESTFFVGLLPLLLFGFCWRIPQRDLVWSWSLVAMLSIILALGAATPLYKIVHTWLPGFGSLSTPSRFLVLFTLALAVGAGLGVAAINDRGGSINRRTAIAAMLVFILVSGVAMVLAPTSANWKLPVTCLAACGGAVALALPPSRRRCIFLVASITLSLWPFGWPYVNQTRPVNSVYAIGPSLEKLSNEERPFRIAADVLPQTLSTRAGLDVVHGYHPFVLTRYADFFYAIQGISERQEKRMMVLSNLRNLSMLDMLNTRYLMGRLQLEESDRFSLVHQDGPIRTYENKLCLPHCYAVGAARAVPADKQIDMLVAQEVDPRRHVLLEEEPVLTGESFFVEGSVIKRNGDSIAASITLPAEGYVVFSELNYPGWTAAVDGEPAAIMTANYLFRAVRVPAGEHLVELKLRPRSLIYGAWLSLFGWLLAAGMLILPRLDQSTDNTDPTPQPGTEAETD